MNFIPAYSIVKTDRFVSINEGMIALKPKTSNRSNNETLKTLKKNAVHTALNDSVLKNQSKVDALEQFYECEETAPDDDFHTSRYFTSIKTKPLQAASPTKCDKKHLQTDENVESNTSENSTSSASEESVYYEVSNAIKTTEITNSDHHQQTFLSKTISSEVFVEEPATIVGACNLKQLFSALESPSEFETLQITSQEIAERVPGENSSENLSVSKEKKFCSHEAIETSDIMKSDKIKVEFNKKKFTRAQTNSGYTKLNLQKGEVQNEESKLETKTFQKEPNLLNLPEKCFNDTHINASEAKANFNSEVERQKVHSKMEEKPLKLQNLARPIPHAHGECGPQQKLSDSTAELEVSSQKVVSKPRYKCHKIHNTLLSKADEVALNVRALGSVSQAPKNVTFNKDFQSQESSDSQLLSPEQAMKTDIFLNTNTYDKVNVEKIDETTSKKAAISSQDSLDAKLTNMQDKALESTDAGEGTVNIVNSSVTNNALKKIGKSRLSICTFYEGSELSDLDSSAIIDSFVLESSSLESDLLIPKEIVRPPTDSFVTVYSPSKSTTNINAQQSNVTTSFTEMLKSKFSNETLSKLSSILTKSNSFTNTTAVEKDKNMKSDLNVTTCRLSNMIAAYKTRTAKLVASEKSEPRQFNAGLDRCENNFDLQKSSTINKEKRCAGIVHQENACANESNKDPPSISEDSLLIDDDANKQLTKKAHGNELKSDENNTLQTYIAANPSSQTHSSLSQTDRGQKTPTNFQIDSYELMKLSTPCLPSKACWQSFLDSRSKSFGDTENILNLPEEKRWLLKSFLTEQQYYEGRYNDALSIYDNSLELAENVEDYSVDSEPSLNGIRVLDGLNEKSKDSNYKTCQDNLDCYELNTEKCKTINEIMGTEFENFNMLANNYQRSSGTKLLDGILAEGTFLDETASEENDCDPVDKLFNDANKISNQFFLSCEND